MAEDPCITTLGLNAARDAVKEHVNDDWLYIAVGDGTTTPSASDTTLEGEHLRKERQETSADTNSRTVSLFINSVEDNGEDIKKVAVFSASTSGTMFFEVLLDSGDYLAKTNTTEVWIDIKATPTVTDTS